MSNDWKNTFETKTFEEFNRKFFKSTATFENAFFFNKKIVLPTIRPLTNAEIEIRDVGCVGDYNGYMIRIIHKDNGQIANEWFPFSAYLKTENKTDYTPHINEYCGIDWWCEGATPESIKTMVAKMLEYISLYR